MIWKNILPYIFILRMMPIFYVVYDSGKPLAIFPLFKKWFQHSYRLYGDRTGCAYLSIIHGKNISIEDITEAISLVKKEIRGDIEVHRVQERTVFGEYMIRCGGEEEEEPCVYIPTNKNYDEYIASLSKNSRNNIRRAYNRANRDGKKISFECRMGEECTSEDYQKTNIIYCKRQASKYYGIKKKLYYLFAKYIDVAGKTHTIAFNWNWLFVVRIDGEIAAYVDTAIYNRTVVLLRLAINEEFSFYNPGKVLVNELMRYMIENGQYDSFDLTHGNDRYKLEMGGIEKKCVRGVI